MESHLKVLHIDVSSGFYKLERFDIGEYFGPVDLGLHLAAEHGSLNFGGGLLAGSVFPGSNRLIFTGYSPCWDNFYISSMGGAALVFDNLGISLAALHGRAAKPSLLYLNRIHGEEIEVQLTPVDVDEVWAAGAGARTQSWTRPSSGSVSATRRIPGCWPWGRRRGPRTSEAW